MPCLEKDKIYNLKGNNIDEERFKIKDNRNYEAAETDRDQTEESKMDKRINSSYKYTIIVHIN